MTKPKISPSQLAKFIAMFDVDERVDCFKGYHGKLESHASMDGVIDYRCKDFLIHGELVGQTEPIHLIIWEEV